MLIAEIYRNTVEQFLFHSSSGPAFLSQKSTAVSANEDICLRKRDLTYCLRATLKLNLFCSFAGCFKNTPTAQGNFKDKKNQTGNGS